MNEIFFLMVQPSLDIFFGNPATRKHPQANKALSVPGAFFSHQKNADVRGPGMPEHLENMEEMATAVNECLKEASFRGGYIEVYRGP